MSSNIVLIKFKDSIGKATIELMRRSFYRELDINSIKNYEIYDSDRIVGFLLRAKSVDLPVSKTFEITMNIFEDHIAESVLAIDLSQLGYFPNWRGYGPSQKELTELFKTIIGKNLPN